MKTKPLIFISNNLLILGYVILKLIDFITTFNVVGTNGIIESNPFAVDLVKKGKFGYAVVLKGIKIAPVKLEKVVEKNRALSKELLKLTDFFSMM